MIASPYAGAGGEWYAVATITTSTSPSVIPIDTEVHSVGGVAVADIVTNNEVEIKKSGYYNLEYTACTDVSSGTNRSIARAYMQIDTGGGYGTVTASISYCYARTTTGGEGTMTRKIRRWFNAGDKLRLRIDRQSGSSTIISIATGCGFSLTYIDDH